MLVTFSVPLRLIGRPGLSFAAPCWVGSSSTLPANKKQCAQTSRLPPPVPPGAWLLTLEAHCNSPGLNHTLSCLQFFSHCLLAGRTGGPGAGRRAHPEDLPGGRLASRTETHKLYHNHPTHTIDVSLYPWLVDVRLLQDTGTIPPSNVHNCACLAHSHSLSKWAPPPACAGPVPEHEATRGGVGDGARPPVSSAPLPPPRCPHRRCA